MHRLPLWAAVMLACLAGQAGAGDLELGECAAIDDDSARLVCYDKLAGRGPAAAPAIAGAGAAVGSDGDATFVPPRLYQEKANATNRFVIIPHERNYLLPITYNSNINEEAWHVAHPGTGMDQAEVKFQISMKAIIWQDILGRDLDLWGAYTQTSWMQAYNTDASSPFRETDYMPELILSVANSWRVLGFRNTRVNVHLNHESNG
ncbi:MAG: phospholipase A, partial [Xanthomonadales bacterium]|nr:phospholipase A [Xanthomonadales bacterium]